MALWKDIVAHWDDESRNTALKEELLALCKAIKLENSYKERKGV